MMNFASDNVWGVSPVVLESLSRANESATVPSYGGDDWGVRLHGLLEDIFECRLSIFPVSTGTAANALSFAAICLAWEAMMCHPFAHAHIDECGAPELMSGGAKILPTLSSGCRVSVSEVSSLCARFPRGVVHFPQIRGLSVTQSCEFGEVYDLDELGSLGAFCRDHDLRFHMDGARFANGLVSLGCSPADMTWRVGVDILSLGFTKNGALGAEVIVVFADDLRSRLPYLVKRSGHLWSKSRFLSCQMVGLLENDVWLENARIANDRAGLLASGLQSLSAVSNAIRVAWRVDANEVFCVIPRAWDRFLRARDVVYHEWGFHPGITVGDDAVCIRLVCSFLTPSSAIDDLLSLLGSLASDDVS